MSALYTEIDLARQAETQVTDYLHADYHKLFDESPREFVDRFKGIFELLKEVDVDTVAGSDLTVLVVVPESMVGLDTQLDLNGHRAFLPGAEMHALHDRGAELVGPYALLGVVLGDSSRGLSAQQATSEILERGDRPLELLELLQVGIHAPEVFGLVDGVGWARGMYAAGTVHQRDDATHLVDLYRYGDRLKVKRDPGTIVDEDWTTPSYSGLVGYTCTDAPYIYSNTASAADYLMARNQHIS